MKKPRYIRFENPPAAEDPPSATFLQCFPAKIKVDNHENSLTNPNPKHQRQTALAREIKK